MPNMFITSNPFLIISPSRLKLSTSDLAYFAFIPSKNIHWFYLSNLRHLSLTPAITFSTANISLISAKEMILSFLTPSIYAKF